MKKTLIALTVILALMMNLLLYVFAEGESESIAANENVRTVNPVDESPETGDSTAIIIFVSLSMLIAFGASVVVLRTPDRDSFDSSEKEDWI